MNDTAKLIVSGSDPPVDQAAQFLACLAYPEDKKARAAYFGALIYYGYENLSSSVGYGLAIRGLTTLIKDECNASVQDILDRGQHVISSKRLIAAKMAYPTFAAAVLKEKLGVQLNVDPPTFGSNAMLDAISRDLQDPKRQSNRGRKAKTGSDVRNDGNVLNRQWKDSLPSLALAITVHEFCRSQNIDGLKIDLLFSDYDVAWRLCKYASLINGLVVEKFHLKQYVQIILNH